MKARLLPVVALSALLGPGGVLAQDKAVAEPAVKRVVSEDDKVRIEELRVRGQTQRITVKSKIPGVAPYEIVPATGARDPSQPGTAPGQGQSVWRFPAF
jgi:hypothetical protein